MSRAALTALALAGCSAEPQLPADPTGTADPVAFFTGRTSGEATLDTLIAAPVRVRVESLGVRTAGGLVLHQRIRTGDKPAGRRRWTMRPTGDRGQYTGTLTDAAGPVTVQISGPRASIRYAMRNGMKVEQALAVQQGGRTMLNRLIVRKWGIRVATLDETIRKSR